MLTWPQMGKFSGRTTDCQLRGLRFESTYCRFETNLIHPTLSICLSEKTLRAVVPVYLVSMPGEVKDPTQGVDM